MELTQGIGDPSFLHLLFMLSLGPVTKHNTLLAS